MPGNLPEVSDPSFIIHFEEDEIVCCIYEPTESLADHIAARKAEGAEFQENFVWTTMAGVIKEFLSGKFDTVMKISTEVIRFHSNGTVFIDPPTNVDQTGHMTEVGGGIEAAVYEAPEVLGRQDPGAKAFSWTVGCVVYEMLALEPAFYDRTGGMNPFSVFMDIMQGNLPPDPTHGSAELIALMGCCFKTDPNKRPSLEYLLDIAEQNIQTLTSMS